MRFVPTVTDPPANIDREAVRRAVAIEPVSLAVVFGSYATGNQGPLSDLDVAVQFRDGLSGPERAALLDDITVAITEETGFEAVDLLDLETVGPRLGYAILSTGMLVHGDRSSAVDLESRFLLRKLDFQPVKQAWDEALEKRIHDGSYGRS
jgi:predicted nucleotidyltransferase